MTGWPGCRNDTSSRHRPAFALVPARRPMTQASAWQLLQALEACTSFVLSQSNGLFVEPDVFHAPAVVHAVDHCRQTLHPRLPAGGPARMEDDRTCPLLLQCSVDFPDQLFAPFLIALA